MDHGFRDKPSFNLLSIIWVLILSLMDHGFRGLKEGLSV